MPNGAPDDFGRGGPTPYAPRVWQPDAVVDLSGAVRVPRVGIPSLSGSRSGPEGGLASGRLARAGLDSSRPASAVPHPTTSTDSLRARYGAEDTTRTRSGAADTTRERSGTTSAKDSGRSADVGTGTRDSGPSLSRARTGSDARRTAVEPTTRGDARTGRATPTVDGERARTPKRSERGADTDARIRSARAGANDLAQADPEQGHRLRAAAKAANDAIVVGTGIVIGTGSGYYGGCDYPNGDVWDKCDPYWNSCWSGGWWWGFSWYWPYYGGCWWYGSSYWNACYPWGGYGWGYGYAPYYTTVVYESYVPETIVVEQPAAEPVPEAAPVAAVPQVAPEVRADLEASADAALTAGDLAFREGRYSDAVRHYARAVEYSPERGSLWLILSDALFATGDYHYAAFSLRRALDLDDTLLETLVDKHAWYADPAEFDRHIAWAEAYMRDHVLDEDARLILAANYLFAKRFASASDALESAFAAGIVESKAGRMVLERSRRALGIGVK